MRRLRHATLTAVLGGALVAGGCTGDQASRPHDTPTATTNTTTTDRTPSTRTDRPAEPTTPTPTSPQRIGTGGRTATPGAADTGDDWEQAVSHTNSQRDFSLHARSIADGVCLQVRSDQGTGQDCGPVEGPIDVRVISIGGQDYVTGVVGHGGGSIVEIDMIANDGSAVSEEFATAELVEIIGQSGFRAFAPEDGPSTYRAVVGLGPDGEEVARIEL